MEYREEGRASDQNVADYEHSEISYVVCDTNICVFARDAIPRFDRFRFTYAGK